MADKNENYRNERGDTRIENANDLRNELENATERPDLSSKQGHDPANDQEGAVKQRHENRENPLADQVPGHLGYNKHDHLINANPKTDEEDL